MFGADPPETVVPIVRRTRGRDSIPLQAVHDEFAALNRGNYPVTVDGTVFPGLPDRPLGLEELRDALLDPHCCHATRDAVWAHLVVCSRSEGAVFTAACLGVALPALARVARRLTRRFADDPSDLHAAVLAGFVDELAVIDLSVPDILVRLRWEAYRAGRSALREALDAPPPLPTRCGPAEPRDPCAHPDLVLARAVAEGVLTANEARLISATRLGEDTLMQLAGERGVAYKTLHQTRRRAEARLAAWLADENATTPTRQSHSVTSTERSRRKKSWAAVSKTAPKSGVPLSEGPLTTRPTESRAAAADPASSTRPVSPERS